MQFKVNVSLCICVTSTCLSYHSNMKQEAKQNDIAEKKITLLICNLQNFARFFAQRIRQEQNFITKFIKKLLLTNLPHSTIKLYNRLNVS